MLIDLRAIPRAGARQFRLCLAEDWWHADEFDNQVLGLDGPLSVNIEIYRAGDKFALRGELAGSLIINCDRCLTPYRQDIKTKFNIFIVRTPQEDEKAEIELLEQDLEVAFTNSDEIELDEIIKEQLYLSIPIKSICKEGCLGLCPVCGSNMNNGDCKCKKEKVHPGFAKLKGLKI